LDSKPNRFLSPKKEKTCVNRRSYLFYKRVLD